MKKIFFYVYIPVQVTRKRFFFFCLNGFFGHCPLKVPVAAIRPPVVVVVLVGGGGGVPRRTASGVGARMAPLSDRVLRQRRPRGDVDSRSCFPPRAGPLSPRRAYRPPTSHSVHTLTLYARALVYTE